MSEEPESALEICVRTHLEIYFSDLNGVNPHAIYPMLLGAVEKPMLQLVLQKAQGNQSRAAAWLGINRNTLRKKLTENGLL